MNEEQLNELKSKLSVLLTVHYVRIMEARKLLLFRREFARIRVHQ